MIIEDKRRENTVIFNDLADGAVFEYDSQVYLKFSSNTIFENKIKINAVNLNTNNRFIFSKDCKVIPLKAKLIIEK